MGPWSLSVVPSGVGRNRSSSVVPAGVGRDWSSYVVPSGVGGAWSSQMYITSGIKGSISVCFRCSDTFENIDMFQVN